MALLAAGLAGTGVYLCWTAAVSAPTGPADPPARRLPTRSVSAWMAQAGLADAAPGQLLGVCAGAGAAGALAAYTVFAGVVPALLGLLGGVAAPLGSVRARRRARLAAARDAWPRLIEEIRLQTGSLGRSVPQALFDVGGRAPAELRPAFDAARHHWALSTDFTSTIALLKHGLADATADVACETLLVAAELGGAGLDRRLADLAEDRRLDVQRRKDAAAGQAGVRFARRFTLLVPTGMAAVGMTIGPGRAAYATAGGQLVVALGLASVLVCWVWAGRLLRLPEPRRALGR